MQPENLLARIAMLEADLRAERAHADRWQKLAGRYDDIRDALRNADELIFGNDRVGGTQFSITIEGVTLCTEEPFTEDEIAALREYIAALKAKSGSSAGQE